MTHVIRGRKVLRHLPHHHRGPAVNKAHAVDAPGLSIRDRDDVTAVCGATVRIEELVEVVGADGGPAYNCYPTTDAKRVTCRDCARKLVG